MIVEIGRVPLKALVAAAEVSNGREICGLLFGTAARIERVLAADNVADDQESSFEIDPRVLFAAMRAERAGGDRLIGHYHSHPNGLAEPSPRDLAAAEPGKYWLILGGGGARLWVMENGGFRELQLVVTD